MQIVGFPMGRLNFLSRDKICRVDSKVSTIIGRKRRWESREWWSNILDSEIKTKRVVKAFFFKQRGLLAACNFLYLQSVMTKLANKNAFPSQFFTHFTRPKRKEKTKSSFPRTIFL